MSKCYHGTQRRVCRLCSPGNYCTAHSKLRRNCADPACGGGENICVHLRQKSTCRECGSGKTWCEHGVVKSKCKDCGGVSICEHGKQKYQCKECGTGKGLCECGINRSKCRKHNGVSFCVHNKDKSKCKDCNITSTGTTGSICKHLLIRNRCKECGAGDLDANGSISKGWCKTGCGSRLSVLRYGGMCAGCDPHKTMRIEDYVKATIDEWSAKNDFGYPSLDGTGFETCGGLKYQPDRAYYVKDNARNDVYIIEIDETAHQERASECENSRMSNIATVMFPESRVIFLRLSTGMHANRTSMSLRVALIMTFLKSVVIDGDPYINRVIPGVSVGVHYFFYADCDRIHIDHAQTVHTLECNPIQILGIHHTETLLDDVNVTPELAVRNTAIEHLEKSRNSLIYGVSKRINKE